MLQKCFFFIFVLSWFSSVCKPWLRIISFVISRSIDPTSVFMNSWGMMMMMISCLLWFRLLFRPYFSFPFLELSLSLLFLKPFLFFSVINFIIFMSIISKRFFPKRVSFFLILYRLFIGFAFFFGSWEILHIFRCLPSQWLLSFRVTRQNIYHIWGKILFISKLIN